MMNDVFTNQKFLVYVVNDEAKVKVIKSIINYRADYSAITIVDHRTCKNGEYYVWQVKCPRFEFDDLMRTLLRQENISKSDLVFKKYDA